VIPTRVPSPNAADCIRQDTKRRRKGNDLERKTNPSVFIRNIAPRVAKSKAGRWIAKPKTNGAMQKDAAVSPSVMLALDLSSRLISLINWRSVHDIGNYLPLVIFNDIVRHNSNSLKYLSSIIS
jgi:hypothetical protein